MEESSKMILQHLAFIYADIYITISSDYPNIPLID